MPTPPPTPSYPAPTPPTPTILLASTVPFAGGLGVETATLIAGYPLQSLVASIPLDSVLGSVQGGAVRVSTSVQPPSAIGIPVAIPAPVSVQVAYAIGSGSGFSTGTAIHVGQVATGAAAAAYTGHFGLPSATRGPAWRTAPFAKEATDISALMPTELETRTGVPKVAFEAFFSGVPHWLLGKNLESVITALGCDALEARARFAHSHEQISGRTAKTGGTWGAWRHL